MRCVAVSQTDFLYQLLNGNGEALESSLFLVGDARTRARLVRRGVQVLSGRLEAQALYRRAGLGSSDLVLLMPGRRVPEKILDAILAVAPGAPVLLIQSEKDRELRTHYPTVTTFAVPHLFQESLKPEMARARLRLRVEAIRQHFEGAERVLILMQDDPDPDAIASGLALRTLLGRNKASAPVATFGAITRPENLALLKVLEIEVERIREADLKGFDRIVLVDVQPPVFEERMPEVDLVIDHHPEAKGYRTQLRDIRPGYGATSTIMTEYLRAAEVKISQKLATALFYGIKSDTLHLERGGTHADMEAFAFLYGLANHNALRRIDQPELPVDALDALATGLRHREIVRGVLFTHLGEVSRPDLIPQFADLCLQVEGIEWSVVSGLVNGELHVSVRNVGYVKAAGEVTRAAFGDLGSAGGHRSAAKAVIPLRGWKEAEGDLEPAAVRRGIVGRFLRALDEENSYRSN